jgi:hypothetical protein
MVASLPSVLHQVKAKGKGHMKAKGKLQKAKGKNLEKLFARSASTLLPFALCLLPFAFPKGFAFGRGFCYSLGR